MKSIVTEHPLTSIPYTSLKEPYCSRQSYLKCWTAPGNSNDLPGRKILLNIFNFLALVKFFKLVDVLISFLHPNILLKSTIVSSFSSGAIYLKVDSFQATCRLEEKYTKRMTVNEFEFVQWKNWMGLFKIFTI